MRLPWLSFAHYYYLGKCPKTIKIKKRVTKYWSPFFYVDPNKVFYISCRLRRQLSIGRRKEMTAAPSQNQLT